MKKSFIIFAIMAIMLFAMPLGIFAADNQNTAASPTISYEDVDSSYWGYKAITSVTEKGYMNGYLENNKYYFKANNYMTRAEFVTILGRYDGADQTTAPNYKFTDIDKSTEKWAGTYIAWAAQNDIVEGVGENKFAPTSCITRQQMATIISRYLEYLGYEANGNFNKVNFKDKTEIADWAQAGVANCVVANIIEGFPDKNFRPLKNMSRAEAATVLARIMKVLEIKESVTSVAVVDGKDGVTEVTAPVVGQVLSANIKCSDGTDIGTYPVNKDVTYTWFYKESPDTVLGNEPSYTVTSDNVGKTIGVKVSVKGYTGEASWEAAKAVDFQEEAQIGDTFYASFTDSIAAAKDGDTVVVLKDIALKENSYISITKDITIKGLSNDITITGKTTEDYNTGMLCFDAGSEGATLEGLTVQFTATGAQAQAVYFNYGFNGSAEKTTTIQNVSFIGAKTIDTIGQEIAIASTYDQIGFVNVKNCSFSNFKYAMYFNALSNANITGNTIDGTRFNAINIAADNESYPCKNIAIKDNTLKNISYANYDDKVYSAGISIGTYSENITVEGNHISMLNGKDEIFNGNTTK